MKLRNIMLTALAILGLAMLTTPSTVAQTCGGTGTNFVDLNGDGFNDNAQDHDGDGIPNGLDADYVKNAQDGTGYQKGRLGGSQEQRTTQMQSAASVGIFARLHSFFGEMFQYRSGATNGSSTGGGTLGSGVCDGTGPHGLQNRGGK